MKKILFVIGSLRAKSFNRQVANVAKEIFGDRAEVQELDYGDLPLQRSGDGGITNYSRAEVVYFGLLYEGKFDVFDMYWGKNS